MIVIGLGYVSGTIHKLMYSMDIVLALYILNGIMVTVDIILYFINRKREKEALEA
jgi:hypothetical protein